MLVVAEKHFYIRHFHNLEKNFDAVFIAVNNISKDI